MTAKQRLAKFAFEIKIEGLEGRSMQKKFAEIVEADRLVKGEALDSGGKGGNAKHSLGSPQCIPGRDIAMNAREVAEEGQHFRRQAR